MACGGGVEKDGFFDGMGQKKDPLLKKAGHIGMGGKFI
jgi:hypothetical protein